MPDLVKPYSSYGAGKRLAGMFVTRDESGFKYYKPNYNRGRTLFRPYGDVAPDGKVVPWWDSTINDYSMGFFIKIPLAVRWGDEFQFTAIVPVRDPDNWGGGSPLELFYDVVWTSKKPQIQRLQRKADGNKYEIPIVSSISSLGMLKGVLFENASKKYHTKPLWRVLLGLPTSASDALNRLLQQARQDPQFDPIDYDRGCVLEFNKESAFDTAGTTTFNVQDDPMVAASAEKESAIESYGCRFFPDNPYQALDAQRVIRNSRPFEEILWFMTGEEQVMRCILPAFGERYRDAVLQAFQDSGVLPQSYLSGKRVTYGENPQVAASPAAAAQAPVQPAQQAAPQTPPPSMFNVDGEEGDSDDDGEGSADEQSTAPSSADAIRNRFRRGNG